MRYHYNLPYSIRPDEAMRSDRMLDVMAELMSGVNQTITVEHALAAGPEFTYHFGGKVNTEGQFTFFVEAATADKPAS